MRGQFKILNVFPNRGVNVKTRRKIKKQYSRESNPKAWSYDTLVVVINRDTYIRVSLFFFLFSKLYIITSFIMGSIKNINSLYYFQ